MLIILVGKSGSGKDYFFNYALKNYPLSPIILHTTRPMRKGEIDGKTYHFVTMDELNSLEEKNLLIERRDYNTVHGIWSYATSSKENDIVNKNYITINTWDGVKKFKNYYEPSLIIPIYISVRDDILLERAINRERTTNQDYLELCRRFIADSKDFTENDLVTYNPIIIDNNESLLESSKSLDNNLKRILKR